MTHILISSDGKVKGSKTEPPDVNLYLLDDDGKERYHSAMQHWRESCLEFEDQRVIQGYLPDSVFTRTEGDESALIPDTILSVELPPTIDVWQYQSTEGLWLDDHSESYKEGNYTIKYRKILRMV